MKRRRRGVLSCLVPTRLVPNKEWTGLTWLGHKRPFHRNLSLSDPKPNRLDLALAPFVCPVASFAVNIPPDYGALMC